MRQALRRPLTSTWGRYVWQGRGGGLNLHNRRPRLNQNLTAALLGIRPHAERVPYIEHWCKAQAPVELLTDIAVDGLLISPACSTTITYSDYAWIQRPHLNTYSLTIEPPIEADEPVTPCGRPSNPPSRNIWWARLLSRFLQ